MTDPIIKRQCEWCERPPSIEILETLAVVENVPVDDLHMELQQPLYEYINPESLDEVVTSQDDVTLGFDIDSYRIRIDDDELRIYGD